MTPNNGSGRGFASLSPEHRREIAKLGGRAAHERGNAHELTAAEGREAGRKTAAAVSKYRVHMARVGRIGGRRRWHRESQSGDRTVG